MRTEKEIAFEQQRRLKAEKELVNNAITTAIRGINASTPGNYKAEVMEGDGIEDAVVIVVSRLPNERPESNAVEVPVPEEVEEDEPSGSPVVGEEVFVTPKLDGEGFDIVGNEEKPRRGRKPKE